MSNIYIYKAGDGAGIAGGHALGTTGRARAVPSGCAVCSWSQAQLPQEGGELSRPGGGVVPSAMLRKEV